MNCYVRDLLWLLGFMATWNFFLFLLWFAFGTVRNSSESNLKNRTRSTFQSSINQLFYGLIKEGKMWASRLMKFWDSKKSPSPSYQDLNSRVIQIRFYLRSCINWYVNELFFEWYYQLFLHMFFVTYKRRYVFF